MRKAHTKAGPEYKFTLHKSSQSYIITNQVFIHESKDVSEIKQRK
jgi:hypothetical protein